MLTMEMYCDLKMIGILRMQQGIYAKIPWLIWDWESVDKKKHWKVSNLTTYFVNVVNQNPGQKLFSRDM